MFWETSDNLETLHKQWCMSISAMCKNLAFQSHIMGICWDNMMHMHFTLKHAHLRLFTLILTVSMFECPQLKPYKNSLSKESRVSIRCFCDHRNICIAVFVHTVNEPNSAPVFGQLE
jgi:hypothetical protein